EKILVKLWAELLGVERVGILDNFFGLGGNSLLAMKMVAILSERYSQVEPVIKLYQFPTIQKFAQAMDHGSPRAQPSIKKKPRKTPKTDIAIIGMAGRFPGARNVEELWDVLLSARETITFFQDHELDSTIPSELRNSPE